MTPVTYFGQGRHASTAEGKDLVNEVAHGRLAKSFDSTATSATGWLQVACIATTLRQLSREKRRRRPLALAA